MTTLSGELIVFGVNIRTYDSAGNCWAIKWLHALTGTWVDLGPKELGGVKIEGGSIVYAFREPVASHRFTRHAHEHF